MKRALLILVVLVVAAGGLVALLGYYLDWFGGPKQAQAAPAGAGGVRVDVVRPMRRTVVQPAQVEPFERVEVIPKIAGYLRNYDKDVDGKPIDTGSRLKPGQLIGTLFVPELQAELQVKQANLKLAQDLVAVAAEQQRVAETDREKYQAELGYREAEFRRHQRLYNEHSIPNDLFDEVTKRKLAAESALNNAIAHITLAQAEYKAAQARVTVAQNEVKRVSDLFAYATLTAPAAEEGALYHVTRRWIDPGAYVQPGSGSRRDSLLSLMRVDKVRVATDQFPELEAPFIETGDEAVFEPASLPGRLFKGTVSRVAQALEMPARTMRVEIDLPNPDGKPLYPGMYGSVRLLLGIRKGVWLLPPSAIRKEEGKDFVFVVTEGKLEKVPVTLGVADGRNVEVLHGVAGETAVVRQIFGTAKPGDAVKVIEAKK